jgi:predicted nucleotidyltransferase
MASSSFGQTVYNINEISAIIEPVAKAYGVGCLALFGSYARGEARENSDIDIRVARDGSLRGFFRLAGLQRELEEKLNVHVDVLPTDALSEEFLAGIKNEEVIVYDDQSA